MESCTWNDFLMWLFFIDKKICKRIRKPDFGNRTECTECSSLLISFSKKMSCTALVLFECVCGDFLLIKSDQDERELNNLTVMGDRGLGLSLEVVSSFSSFAVTFMSAFFSPVLASSFVCWSARFSVMIFEGWQPFMSHTLLDIKRRSQPADLLPRLLFVYVCVYVLCVCATHTVQCSVKTCFYMMIWYFADATFPRLLFSFRNLDYNSFALEALNTSNKNWTSKANEKQLLYTPKTNQILNLKHGWVHIYNYFIYLLVKRVLVNYR